MTHFEYITVAVSIVLSFAMIRLVDGLRAVFFSRARYWVHSVWILEKLFSTSFYWWLMWIYRGESFNLGYFIYFLLGPLIMYGQASLLMPPKYDDEMSWREHYYSVFRPYLTLQILFAIHSAIGTSVVLQQAQSPDEVIYIQAAIVALAVIGLSSRRAWIQGGVVLMNFAVMLVGAGGMAFYLG